MNHAQPIDPADLEAFRKTLPVGVQQECRRQLGTIYDIVKALYLIHREGLTPYPVDVVKWCRSLGMDGQPREGLTGLNILTGVTDEDSLKPGIDTTVPLIFAEHTFRGGKTGPVLIDGNHRLRKAFLKSKATVQGYYIPKPLVDLIIE